MSENFHRFVPLFDKLRAPCVPPRRRRPGAAATAPAAAAPRASEPAAKTAQDPSADVSSPALRLIGLLEQLSRADKPQTLTEIIGLLRQPKPTVYRMLQQLEQAGLLVKEPDGKRYAPGPRLSRLAEDVLLNAQVRASRHARPMRTHSQRHAEISTQNLRERRTSGSQRSKRRSERST